MRNPVPNIFESFVIRTHRGPVTYRPPGTSPNPVSSRDQNRRGAVSRLEVPPGWGATFYVGLNRRRIIRGKSVSKPTYTGEQIRDFVLKVRRKQLPKGVEHGASIVKQLGFWDKIGSGVDPREKSVVLNIMSLSDETVSEFTDHMIELAEGVTREFEQDSVPMHLHEGGVIKKTIIFGTSLKGDVPNVG